MFEAPDKNVSDDLNLKALLLQNASKASFFLVDVHTQKVLKIVLVKTNV